MNEITAKIWEMKAGVIQAVKIEDKVFRLEAEKLAREIVRSGRQPIPEGLDRGEIVSTIYNNPIYKNVAGQIKDEICDGEWHHTNRLKSLLKKYFPAWKDTSIQALTVRYKKYFVQCGYEYETSGRSKFRLTHPQPEIKISNGDIPLTSADTQDSKTEKNWKLFSLKH